MKKLVAVLIPIYKEKIDQVEQMCLTQAIKILAKHPIIFFAPFSLDTTYYENYCSGKVNFTIERFEDEYFLDIKGYNKLMLGKEFYRRFIDFKYILIHQLDAFVFKDELEYWCLQEFDYIGAPYAFIDMDNYPIQVLKKFRSMLKLFQKFSANAYKFKQVGNGGFSLRNVKKTLFLLNFKRLQPKLWSKLMEDNYFQYWGNLMAIFFKLPHVEIAAKFSIEIEPRKTFQLAKENLPFGCHAFMRYDFEFWKPILKKEGYIIE